MRVYLKTANGELKGAYFVSEDDYRAMCKYDSWRITVYIVNNGVTPAFVMEQDAYKMTPTSTSSTTITFYRYSSMGTGSSTGEVFTYTHFRYVGWLYGSRQSMAFKNLGEMIDVMCTKHRMLK